MSEQSDQNRNGADGPEPIVIYNSTPKLGFLSLLGFAMSAFAAQSLISGDDEFGGDPVAKVAALLVGLLAGGVLLQWAFDRRPALIIDQDGITPVRPPLGLVPWRVIVGLGLSKSALVRSNLMVAVDESLASEEELARWKRHKASGFLNPAVSRFRRRMGQAVTLQMPISFLAISKKRLRLLLEERVDYHGDGPA